ncbi:hypothetical protein Ccrd_020833 [Cynara cardunculus var. scolymus]|uniref:Uncharacterized protein n=1 Tax=Cynara cardunculus var. scolymus TaxID=59895 RepID=A0A103Y1Q6_CYNCS|nr:hypothetical protein Ccrd_020833 [Cynara cardunculus var. scolymus]
MSRGLWLKTLCVNSNWITLCIKESKWKLEELFRSDQIGILDIILQLVNGRKQLLTLMEVEPEKYQSHFSEYIKAIVDPENIEELYKKVHQPFVLIQPQRSWTNSLQRSTRGNLIF